MKSTIKMLSISALLLSPILLNQTAWSARGLEDLTMFKSGSLGQGLWRMELLSSSDTTLSQGAAAVGKMSICADVAKQMAQNSQLDEQSCTPKVLRNTKDVAEVDVMCTDGTHSHVIVNRENEQTYVLDSQLTKDGKTRAIKARYSHEGACKSDAANSSLIQLDKNSVACKTLSSMDAAKITSLCANSPEQYRAQCEQQAKQLGNICQ
jgi:hypothetical protein